MRDSATLVCSLVILIAMDVQAQTFKIGDTVMVTSWNAKLAECGKDLNTRVEIGDIFNVTKINGDWLWTGRGWINKSNVAAQGEAISFFSAQIRRDPAKQHNYHDRAAAYLKMGKLDEAIADEDIAIRLNPGEPVNLAVEYNSRGLMRLEKGDYNNAIADYDEAIRLDSKFGGAYFNRARAWQRKKHIEQAIADFNEAIRLEPNEATNYSGRAEAWESNGNYDRAIDDCNEAICLDPKCVYAYADRADVCRKKGDYGGALADYNQAILLDANNPYAYNGRAWLWATCPDRTFRDGSKAVRSATKACELTNWLDSSVFDTLAASYAEKGDYDLAVKWQARALEMRPDDAEFQKGGKERCELYKSAKSFREELTVK